jgi:hypothetical protein
VYNNQLHEVLNLDRSGLVVVQDSIMRGRLPSVEDIGFAELVLTAGGIFGRRGGKKCMVKMCKFCYVH